MFLPELEAVTARARGRPVSQRGRSPIPTAASARWSRRRSAPRPRRRPSVYTSVGDTGAAAALLGALAAMDTPGVVAVVGTGGGRTTGVFVEVESAVPGAAAVAAALDGGRPATYAELLRARGQFVPGGETIPDGGAARERAVRTRRRRDARSARRPLRRLRHDQHAAVDPPHVHQLRRPQARAGRARTRAARSTPT